MVVVVHVDDILAHAKDQSTKERIAVDLGRKFIVKSMVETFGIKKASRAPTSSGGPILAKADKPQAPKEN